MSGDEKFEHAVERAVAWQSECHVLTNGVQFETTPRKRVAVAFQHLSLEHHDGLLDLVHGGFHGPAFALYRPQFDAYTRGIWYRTCASEARVTALLDDERQPPKLDDITADVEGNAVIEPGILSGLKKTMYSRLCDFTHGGTAQIVARLKQHEIAPAYRPLHLAWLVTSSSSLSYLACVELAKSVENDDLIASAYRIHSRIYPELKEALDRRGAQVPAKD